MKNKLLQKYLRGSKDDRSTKVRIDYIKPYNMTVALHPEYRSWKNILLGKTEVTYKGYMVYFKPWDDPELVSMPAQFVREEEIDIFLSEYE